MYTSSNITGTYSDSKYTVADILSSMANGQPTTTSYSDAGSYMSGIVTGTTPTLTPTTLASIEQTFIELTSVPATTAADNNTTADLSRQSGFVPPVVHPASSGMSIKSEYSDFCECDDNSSDSNWGVPEPKRSRSSNNNNGQTTSVISYAQTSSASTTATNANGTPRKTPGRRGRNDVLSPEEDAKRRLRRERNKLAAAKCRQRRVDHTNTLIGETEELEEVRASLENEIQQLQQQKEQLEFLLDAHKPMCGATKTGLLPVVKAEPPEDAAACSSGIAVKVEPPASAMMLSAATTGASTSYGARPTSLPLPVQTLSSSTQATGVMISTPSNNVFSQIGLESMVDGHTGLTPITGPPSCASEVKRASSDSSPNESLGSPTRLMAL